MLCFFCSSLFWRGGRGGGGGSDAVSNPFLGDEHATVMQCITLCPCYHQQIHERSNKEQLCLCEQWIGPLLVFWWSLFLSPSLSPKSSILQWHAMWTINWTFTCVLMICLPLSLSLSKLIFNPAATCNVNNELDGLTGQYPITPCLAAIWLRVHVQYVCLQTKT